MKFLRWFGSTTIPLVCAFGIMLMAVAFDTSAADRVTLQLKWLHQAQFAGFYVALEKGFYADENLDVALIPGGNKVDIAQSLATGAPDFAVLAPEDIIIKRSQGTPLTAIAAIYRRSAVVYLAMPESGIAGPKDFIGKTVAAGGQSGSVRDFELQLTAMMKNMGIDLSAVKVVPYDPGYADFCNGTTNVTASYITGGLIKIRGKGYHPNVIWPGDYRVRFYSDTLATTDRMIAEHPERVARFLRATLKGWRTAIGDPSGTVDIVLKHAVVKDRELQTAMFDAMIPLVHTGEDSIGWMQKEDWREMHRMMVDQGLIERPLDPVDQIYTLRFLEAVQKGESP